MLPFQEIGSDDANGASDRDCKLPLMEAMQRVRDCAFVCLCVCAYRTSL